MRVGIQAQGVSDGRCNDAGCHATTQMPLGRAALAAEGGQALRAWIQSL